MSDEALRGQLVQRDLLAIAGVTVHENRWRHGQPAVYMFSDCDFPYYVGLATNLPRRLQEHRRAGLGKLDAEYVEVRIYPVWSLKAAQRLERNLILFYEPKANDAVPRVSENEKAWYQAVMRATAGIDRGWTFCPQCGELLVHLYSTPALATRGAQCDSCKSWPQWDPSEGCWSEIAGMVASLFGQPYDSLRGYRRRRAFGVGSEGVA